MAEHLTPQNIISRPWRTGRKVHRTIYVQMTDHPRDDDPLIGVMDHPRLASEAVQAHNLQLAAHLESINKKQETK